MLINGKDITFHLNIRASKRIAALCPGRDITHIDEIFNRTDFVEFMDNMVELAVAMSLNKDNEQPLTADDLEELDITELNNLVEELQRQFRADKQTTVETQPIKKKDTGAEEESQSD